MNHPTPINTSPGNTLTPSLAQDEAGSEANQADRRLYTRLPFRQSAKIYDPVSRKYLPARILDLSSGGAKIEIRGHLLSVPGEIIELAADFESNSPVLNRDNMRKARLVRFETVDEFTGTQRIGLAFVQSAYQLAPAA